MARRLQSCLQLMAPSSTIGQNEGQLQVRTRTLLETASDLDVSIVELVVAACECSDDAAEIDDLIDGLVDSGRVRVRRREADPMFAQAF